MMGGTNYTAEIERTLMGLGFSREDFNRPTSEFSGGWRMRIELAKLLLRRPDVLAVGRAYQPPRPRYDGVAGGISPPE